LQENFRKIGDSSPYFDASNQLKTASYINGGVYLEVFGKGFGMRVMA
jgi:hypothetical protein